MDPGLLSDSGAGRGLCPGNRPPASAPGRASRFFKRQPPHAPGIFPFYSQPGLCLRTRKKRYKTALCFRLLFSGHGLSSDNGAAGLGAGLAGASLAVLFFLSLFLSFTSVRLGVFLGRKSVLALENSRQLPGSRRSLDPSRTGGLVLILLGILKLL